MKYALLAAVLFCAACLPAGAAGRFALTEPIWSVDDQSAIETPAARDWNRYHGYIDGYWRRLAFAKDRKLQFPLLSDFEPKGEVARNYGAYRQQDGFSERALFVVDSEGTIRWSYVSPLDVNPGAEGVLDALEALDSKREVAA